MRVRPTWGTRLGFVLATAGAAVGLGNVWRFPTVVAHGGGGAFVAVFLIIVAAVGIPALMGELAIGRHAARGPVGAFRRLAPGTRWPWVGGLGVAAAVAILSFYSVIAGWCLGYAFHFLTGRLANVPQPELESTFVRLVASPAASVGWHSVFMGLTALVVFFGIRGGIERASKLLMPAMVLLLAIVAVRVLRLEGAMEGLAWFLSPRWRDITAGAALAALGQVFFSFSLGMGVLITYGSYLQRDSDLPGAAVWVAAADVGIALLAGSVVIPALFAFDLPIEGGPRLLFVVLTGVFGAMPLGRLLGFLFFLLLVIAALTSAIALLEVGVTTLMDEWRWSRPRSVVAAAAFTFLLGVPSALSQGPAGLVTVFGLPFLEAVDFFASNLMLPVGGLLTAVFIGWTWGTGRAQAELATGTRRFRAAGVWGRAMRYLVPVAVGIVLLGGLLAG